MRIIFKSERILTCPSRPPYNFKIELKDDLPLNLSGLNYHNIRLWIDNNQTNSIILNDLFNCNSVNSEFSLNLKTLCKTFSAFFLKLIGSNFIASLTNSMPA